LLNFPALLCRTRGSDVTERGEALQDEACHLQNKKGFLSENGKVLAGGQAEFRPGNLISYLII